MKPTILQRLAGRFVAFMFDAAEYSRDRNARAFFDRYTNTAEDSAVIQYERDRLIAQTRDLARNNPIVAGLLQRLGDMTLGQGIEPRATTSSREWNEKAEALWHRWALDPEGRGISNLQELLTLCVIGQPVEGGAAIVKYADGTIEQVELARFRPHPDEAGGKPYKTDSAGRITHWCIWGRDANGNFGDKSLAKWVAAWNVLTMFRRTRPDQVMPVPELAHAVNILRDMKELNDYTLRQAKVQSAPALIHNKADDEDELPVRSRRAAREEADPFDRLAEATGLPIISTRGDVKPLAPATPSSTYEQFQRYNLKLVAMSLSIPLDVLMLWFSDGTYSSSKATLTQAHEAILQRQNRLVQRILLPLWQWKMANAVSRGILPPPPPNDEGFPAYDFVEFRLPSYEWMDAQDQTQTEAQEVMMGVRTLGEMARKRGHDLYDLLEERAQEMQLAREIAAKYGLEATQLSQVVLNGMPPPAQPQPEKKERPDEAQK